MPHTYSKLLAHVVWATKERRQEIGPEIRGDLHAYIGGIVRQEGGTALAIGGTADHVHMLVEFPAGRNLSDEMRVVKTNSSRWVHERWPEKRTFAWQAGYGAFAVSSSNAERVIHYIATQEQHHQKLSFRDEFVTLLRRHGVSFDEQYLWS